MFQGIGTTAGFAQDAEDIKLIRKTLGVRGRSIKIISRFRCREFAGVFFLFFGFIGAQRLFEGMTWGEQERLCLQDSGRLRIKRASTRSMRLLKQLMG